MTIRLDKLVAERFGLSRRSSQEAILNGRVDLNGERCHEPGRMVEPDASVEFFPNRPKARRVLRAGLAALFEDQHLLIVDKPAGLPILSTASGEGETLIQRVERYLTLRHGRSPQIGVVHRLDRDMSGALALAKSREALQALQPLFRSQAVDRQFLAVVEGNLTRESRTIDLPLIGRGERRRGVARSPEEGVRAVTHYRVVERFGPVASLLVCWFETDRMHQIRIHLAGIGHPVVGDPIYRPRQLRPSKARFRRPALHAQTLGFRHPLTGRNVRVEAPLPSDLAAFVSDLRSRFGIPGAGG